MRLVAIGENYTLLTQLSCFLYVPCILRSRVDHIFTNLSSPADAIKLPSHEYDIDLTFELCAFVIVTYFV